MNNSKISDTLDQLADLLEFQGANAFRLRAYRNGAQKIRTLGQSIADFVTEKQDLTRLDGIGKSTAEKCVELVETGKLQQLVDLQQQIPSSVLDLLRVPNLGAKKAAKLYDELGIKNLDELATACREGKVATLAGFGEKTQAKILDGISIAAAANERIYWSAADELVARLRDHFSHQPAVSQIEFAGSYRRGKETVGDLDILIDSTDSEQVMDHFATFEDIASTIGRGNTKMSVRLESGFQIDLRVVPTKSFGAALQYFSGSKEHNVEIRSRAKSRNLLINEWGVFRIESAESEPVDVGGKTEADIYSAVELPWITPELREGRGEITLAQTGELPELIELADIRGDLHMHTTATDGKASIEEMAAAAKSRGYQYIAITDHSQRVSMANGLDGPRLLAQWKRIDQFNEQSDGSIHLFKGIECDILESGGMDLPDEVLSQADWVLASVHYGQQQSREQITDRIIGAIENPFVTAIAHPTGRLINRRKAYDVDLTAVNQAAAQHDTYLELNANPARLDLHDIHLQQAIASGVKITINSDAHSTIGLDVMRHGIQQARRGWLTAAHVLNCHDLAAVKKVLSSRKQGL